MEVFLYLLLGLVLLLVFTFIMPLEFRIIYGRINEDDLLSLEMCLWPGMIFHYKIPMMDITVSLNKISLLLKTLMEKGSGNVVAKEKKKVVFHGFAEIYRQIKLWIDIIHIISPSLNYIKNRISISDLKWTTRFGLDDPSQTGIISGLVWSLKGYTLSMICNQIKLTETPALEVIPVFKKESLSINFNCKIKTKIGYLLIFIIKVFALLSFNGKASVIKKIIRKIASKFL